MLTLVSFLEIAAPTCAHFPGRDRYGVDVDEEIQFLLCCETWCVFATVEGGDDASVLTDNCSADDYDNQRCTFSRLRILHNHVPSMYTLVST